MQKTGRQTVMHIMQVYAAGRSRAGTSRFAVSTLPKRRTHTRREAKASSGPSPPSRHKYDERLEVAANLIAVADQPARYPVPGLGMQAMQRCQFGSGMPRIARSTPLA